MHGMPALRASFTLTLLSLSILAGCDCAPPPTSMRCTSSTQCTGGRICTDGACVVGTDAFTVGAPDTGVLPDAWSCPTEDRCGAMCCGDGDECVDETTCLPVCETLRCGADHTCCPAGDLCIADACTTPGDPCTEELDCPADAFCDPALGRCLPRGPARCEYFPPPGVFTPEEQWAWSGSTVEPTSVHVMMAPTVGDVDGDGTPEVVFHTYTAAGSYGGAGVLRIVHGDTGEELTNIVDPVVCPEFGIALGDLDADGVVEIISAIGGCTASQIAAFHADGTEVWRSTRLDGTPWTARVEFGAPSIADLDGDGRAEVVIGGAVLNDEGVLAWEARSSAASGCCAPTPRSPLSAVYDMDDDPELEVVAGNAVWNHDGTVLWEEPTLADGYVAVADFYADMQPDVVVVHEGFVSIRNGRDGTVLFGPVAMPGGGRGGPPTVADFDGDELPEIGIAGSTAYAVFDPDGPMPVLWQRMTQDSSSNITGSSVFDFDGDGRAEVVYNDECYMRVYSGLDGTVLAQVAQNSHTLIEYPLIVDVDADGNAEIVFAANSAVNRCGGIPGYDGLRAGIRVFRDAADNWVGTRPVWNEHSYHVTNVRESLGIPAREVANWTRFNTFRQNSQSFDAPDLVAAEPSSDGDGCPDALVLRATIRNDGAVTVGAGLPVTFYLGTEAMPGRAVATVRTTAAIPPGGSATVTATFTPTTDELGMGLPFFVRVDDGGDGTGENNECQEGNNVSEATYDCGSVG
ncbi:MAG: hypothetical protein J0L92_03035 [Deltaproteobacteria bacterium]|nr:hypothetical protein [Deltaproteobacteria bacterium]